VCTRRHFPCLRDAAAHMLGDTRKVSAWKIVRLHGVWTGVVWSGLVWTGEASKARTCYQTLSLPFILASSNVPRILSLGTRPRPLRSPSHPLSTVVCLGRALAVIKRLNNASCLIIIYDTRHCRLLPKTHCRVGGGKWESGKAGRHVDWKML